MNNANGLTISHAAFLAFFPGYSLYQSLIVFGYAPPLFGGFSTFISLCFMPFLAFYLFGGISSGKIRVNYADITFFIFWILFFLTATNGYLKLNDTATPIAHFSVLIQFFTFYACLRQIPQASRASFVVFGVSFAIACIIMLTTAGSSEEVESIAAAARLDEVYFRDYQGYALNGIISGIIFAALLEKPIWRLMVYAVLIICLYINGARSELVVALPAVLLIEYLIEGRLTFALGCIIIAALGAFTFLLVASSVYDSSNRTLALIRDYQSDVSYIERTYASDMARITIDSHPIMGSYASYPEGFYAHNALSAWVDLGFVGFVLYLTIIIGPAFFLLGNRRWLDNRHIATLAAFTLVMVLLILSAKGFTYKLLPVLVGLHASLVSVARSRRTGEMVA